MTLPIIEQLRDMTRDEARADWLQKCPFSVLLRHQAEISAVLEAAQFGAGVRCLETELALLASVRSEDGRFRQEPLFAANMARSDMRMAAKRGAATPAGGNDHVCG